MSSKISIPLPSPSSAPDASPIPALTPNLRSAINNALLAHNAVPKIQAALLHQCQATGFTASLRQRTLELLRSGECNSYSEVMERIFEELKIGPSSGGGGGEDGVVVNGNGSGNGKNGTTAPAASGLKVPSEVIREGIEIVRHAIEPVVTVGEKSD